MGKCFYGGNMANIKQSAVAEKATYAQQERQDKNLCVNCKFRDDCQFAKNSTEPILFCEEFDLDKQTNLKMVLHKENSQRNSETAAQEFKGLCRNCEKRDTCTYPKPEGGIWHCEEYL